MTAIVSLCFLLLCLSALFSVRFDSKGKLNVVRYSLGYDAESVVGCLESAPDSHRIVFMGDSRLWHMFYSFTQALPNFDFRWNGTNMREWAEHGDQHVDSYVLNVSISFKWRPYIDDSLDEIASWMKEDKADDEIPTLLLLGMASWHIEHVRNTSKDSYGNYVKWLEHLAPLLQTPTPRVKVLWMSQLPVSDQVDNHFFKTYQSSIDRYNLAARKILGASVTFWDLHDRIGEQYLRSCRFNWRTDPLAYWQCGDNIHPGYVVLDQTTNLILSSMCPDSFI